MKNSSEKLKGSIISHKLIRENGEDIRWELTSLIPFLSPTSFAPTKQWIICLVPCRGLGATYANGWLIMVGPSRTSPVPGSGIRRRHERRRTLPRFRALLGDNTPSPTLRGLRMITKAQVIQWCTSSCMLEAEGGKASSLPALGGG